MKSQHIERYQPSGARAASPVGEKRQNTNDQTVTSYNSGKN